MGLEFLAWPWVEDSLAPKAATGSRRIHLARKAALLPYGVAVDLFSIWFIPATPPERHAMWQEMERTYLPWRDYGDLPHVADGGWHFQRHIICTRSITSTTRWQRNSRSEYWATADKDFDEAIKSCVLFCTRGGEAPSKPSPAARV